MTIEEFHTVFAELSPENQMKVIEFMEWITGGGDVAQWYHNHGYPYPPTEA